MPPPLVMTARSVRATLDGRKTATRRVVVPQPTLVGGVRWEWAYETGKARPDEAQIIAWSPGIRRPESPLRFCPHGQPGDVLWVKEPYVVHGDVVGYRATDAADYGGGLPSLTRWKSPRSMPRELSRLFLELVSVRCEQLSRITDQDCLDEGWEVRPRGDAPAPLRAMFLGEWDRLNGKRGYHAASDPWVWVLDYKVVKKEGHGRPEARLRS